MNLLHPSALSRAAVSGGPLEVRTVELVEDDPSMQRALSMALRAQGFVVDVYASRSAYVAAQRSTGPRVVLLDMRLSDCSGLEILDWLRERGDDAAVVFISGQSAPQEIIDALKRGAHDFLLKPVRLAQLLEVVGGAFERHKDAVTHRVRMERLHERWARLTRREREVCVLMLQGMANREIARLHGSVPGTVKVHRARVLEKMGVQSLSDLFRMTMGEDLAAWLDRDEDSP